MQQRNVASIEPGTEVCDGNGDKLGTVAHVHQMALATSGGGGAEEHESFLEVKTGFLGLGKHLFIPASAIQEVLQGQGKWGKYGTVFLTATREQIIREGWDKRPTQLGMTR